LKINDLALTMGSGSVPTKKTMAKVHKCSAISPSSASPVLKTKLTLSLDSDFPYTLDKSHFTVNATSTTDAKYIRFMNVLSVDDTNKKLVVIFGGAKSGSFQLWIRHKAYGLIDTKDRILDVSGSVTSYSPKEGSIYGGTLLTIQGKNFGTVKTDNPVSIVHSAGKNVDCFVQSTKATEIKCRIATSKMDRTPNEEATMQVFLKTSEEAKCTSPACKWKYVSTVPVIQSMAATLDAANDRYQVKVTGTGFVGDKTAISLEVGGVAQETISASSTEAIFAIKNIPSGKQSKTLMMYFPIGIPKDHSVVQAGFDLEPKLTKVTASGTSGGTLVKATILGVGTATTGLSLVDANGVRFCDDLKITAYSKVECWARGTRLVEPRGCKEIRHKHRSIKSLDGCRSYLLDKDANAKYFFYRNSVRSDLICAQCPSGFSK